MNYRAMLWTCMFSLFGIYGFMHYFQHDRIVGTWISLTNAKSKYVFSSDNYAKFYYNGELLDTFTYQVTRTSPQCGVVQQSYLQANPDTSILILVSTKDGIKNCDLMVFSENGQHLTLNAFGRGPGDTYERQ